MEIDIIGSDAKPSNNERNFLTWSTLILARDSTSFASSSSHATEGAEILLISHVFDRQFFPQLCMDINEIFISTVH